MPDNIPLLYRRITGGSLLLGLALVLLVVIAAFAYRDLAAFREARERSIETRRVLDANENLLSSVKDAETGERGYLLTGERAYLQPYRDAIERVHGSLADLARSTANRSAARVRSRELAVVTLDKLDELRQTIQLHDRHGFVAALALVTTDRGLRDMERIRVLCDEIRSMESSVLTRTSDVLEASAARSRYVIGFGSFALFLLVTCAAIAIDRDITQQAKLAADLSASEQRYRALAEELEIRVQKRTSELESANKELETFSYSVSHDLRAPLRTIDGFSLALIEDYAGRLDDQGTDMLARVRSATQRMGALIDDMLKLARVSRTELRREKVSLSGIAESVLADLKRTQPERDVTTSIAENVVVTGDGALLRVAMENLLLNAWKFTSRRARAELAFGVHRGDGGRVYFIKDNGEGFDMAYAGRLFAPFQRLHDQREFEGTGVGLATVQRIIHRHGGRIWADAAVDQGATFRFTLP
ncbi:MAG: CHASE3 domain-containing protein [Acidobacteriota bacterium]|nr:CHASE3 domain-containing protein [Acidobacteriota bacterium]